MSDAGRVSLVIRRPDGSSTRWGPDETDATNIPQDLTWSSSAPGGHRDLTCSLLRGITPGRDEGLFDTVQAIGAGGTVLWEGRLHQVPRQSGTAATATPSAIGYQALLDDNPTFMESYVDRDPGSWGDAPLEWRAAQGASAITSGDMTTTGSSGGFSVNMPNQPVPAFAVTEWWHSAPAGCKAGAVYLVGTENGTPAGWVRGFTSTDSRVPAGSMLDPLVGTYNGLLSENVLGTPRRYVIHRVYSNGTAATPASGANVTVSKIAVFGSSGVPAFAIFGEPPGVLASDVVANVISRAAPLLTFTTGTAGSIQPTTYPIPHLTFREMTSPNGVITAVNAYHQWNYGVWENREFFYEPVGRSGTVWQARRTDGAELSLEGESGDDVYNAAVVSYTDVDGVQKIAGPVGSGLDVESAELTTVDKLNAASTHNTYRPLVVTLSNMTDDTGAVTIGAVKLAAANVAGRKGQITLTGMVRHPQAGLVPVSRVRAGDWVTFTDLPGDSPRIIMEASYNHAQRQVSLGVNGPLPRTESLLERLNAYTGLLGS